jgi:hypothetical protein
LGLCRTMILLEGVYASLIPQLRYRMGIMGPELDLFFWNVLLNKEGLAMEMWRHVRYPVRSAVCASWMLKNVAKSIHTDLISRDKLLENADLFESQAIAVQEAAEHDDLDMALKSVDCELFVFRGWALLDVAIESGCKRFVETKTCRKAIYNRLYGDISPRVWESWTGN